MENRYKKIREDYEFKKGNHKMTAEKLSTIFKAKNYTTLTPEAIRKIETYKRNVSEHELKGYIEVFDTTADYLLGFTDEPSRSHVTLYRILPDKSAFIPFGFNTSHVTLYQNIRLTRIKLSVCFNTSHVTLYQHDQEDVMQKLMFQYISCYSLSQKHQQKRRTKLVSIHLMLLFIPSFYRLFFF